MDAIREAYERSLSTYHAIKPFIPQSLFVTLSSLQTNLTDIFYTLLTNPSELPQLWPSILSTLALLLSTYWALNSAYHAIRRTYSVTKFLIKWSSVTAVLLGGIGYFNPDPAVINPAFGGVARPGDAGLTPGRAIISGWHTVAGLVEAYAEATSTSQTAGRRTKKTSRSSSNRVRGRKVASSGRKIWDKFDDTPPSSNTRSKAGVNGRKRAGAGSYHSSDTPQGAGRGAAIKGLGDGGDVLSWVSHLVSSGSMEGQQQDGDGHESGNPLKFAVEKVFRFSGLWPNIDADAEARQIRREAQGSNDEREDEAESETNSR